MKEQVQNDSRALKEKVEEWLSKEGYPLEFQVASIFRDAFHVRQGFHVEDSKTGAVREIDVVASADSHFQDSLIRLVYVVECKWTKDKPWVVFTSKYERMAPSACISQTIASQLGHSALWCMAGNADLQKMETFSSPLRAGFSGKQAFGGGKDHCYSAMQSVVTASYLLSEHYDRRPRSKKSLPPIAFVALPLIVINGPLFEAYFDEDAGKVQVLAADMIRLHWRGAESWRFMSTIDVVTAPFLGEFVKKRKGEIDVMLNIIKASCENIAACFAKGDLTKLKVEAGSRGILGLPSLLVPLARPAKGVK